MKASKGFLRARMFMLGLHEGQLIYLMNSWAEGMMIGPGK